MKNYIDPTTYDNPERAVMEFAKELDRNVIKFEAIIGGGKLWLLCLMKNRYKVAVIYVGLYI